jgi:hypothetical protein
MTSIVNKTKEKMQNIIIKQKMQYTRNDFFATFIVDLIISSICFTIYRLWTVCAQSVRMWYFYNITRCQVILPVAWYFLPGGRDFSSSEGNIMFYQVFLGQSDWSIFYMKA